MIWLLALFMFSLSFAFADESDESKNYPYCAPLKGFYEDKMRGWFWKEYCPLTEEKKYREKAEKEKVRKEVKKDITVDVIKENLDNPDFWKNNLEVYRKLRDDDFLAQIDQKSYREILDRVVYYSSLDAENEEKIGAAVHMVDFTRRKSRSFTFSYGHYVKKNSEYNLVARGGNDSWNYREISLIKDRKKKDYIRERADRIALIFFVSSGCPYCMRELPIIEKLKEEFPEVYIRFVSSDSCDVFLNFGECSVDPGLFGRFRVEVTPTSYLFYKFPTGESRVIINTVGMVGYSELVSTTFLSLYRLENGEWKDPLDLY